MLGKDLSLHFPYLNYYLLIYICTFDPVTEILAISFSNTVGTNNLFNYNLPNFLRITVCKHLTGDIPQPSGHNPVQCSLE